MLRTTALIAAAAGSAYAHADPVLLHFASYIKEFGKEYAKEEFEARLEAFRGNWEAVEAANAAGGRVEFGLNQYSDLTADEFAAQILMSPRVPPAVERPAPTGAQAGDLPDAFDWAAKGAVTPVKDQGSAGTCWTFSTTGLMEGYYFLSGAGDLTAFSEEWITECDASYNATSGHADCGVFGGWNDLAVANVLEAGGLPTEESIPYCSGGGDKSKGIAACYPCTPDVPPHQQDDDWGWDDDWGSASGSDDDDYSDDDDDDYSAEDDDGDNPRPGLCGPSPSGCNMTYTEATCADAQLTPIEGQWAYAPQDETELAQHLVDNGPISILIDAVGLQSYKGGIWEGKGVIGNKCSDTEVDHAVLLTGFGTDETDGDYWVVKNSWGTSWGEDGYFRATRGVGLCGLNNFAVEMLLSSE